MRLVLVHGRSQQGKNPVELQQTWEQTLDEGLAAAGLKLPPNTVVSFPFYGDELDRLVQQLESPSVAEVVTKGAPIADRELEFRVELANELARNAGLSNGDINAQLEPQAREKGPLQWEWVQAILRALDRDAHVGGAALDLFTRDASVYLTYPAVAKRVDDIVLEAIDGEGPCVVVGHSLGSILSYHVLSALEGRIDVRAFVTLGSPLGLNAVRTRLRTEPLAMPQRVRKWQNAYDERDVVALLPLDSTTWPIDPVIENFSNVKNGTDNAHGIAGYLNDRHVAAWVAKALT